MFVPAKASEERSLTQRHQYSALLGLAVDSYSDSYDVKDAGRQLERKQIREMPLVSVDKRNNAIFLSTYKEQVSAGSVLCDVWFGNFTEVAAALEQDIYCPSRCCNWVHTSSTPRIRSNSSFSCNMEQVLEAAATWQECA